MLIQTIETNSSSKLHIDPAENLSSYFLVLKNFTDKRSSTKSYMSGLFFWKNHTAICGHVASVRWVTNENR